MQAFKHNQRFDGIILSNKEIEVVTSFYEEDEYKIIVIEKDIQEFKDKHTLY
jgi:hypothetical protein